LVYRLTGSVALLGITAFCALIPQLLVGPLAGAGIDKFDKKKCLIGVQGLLALQGFVLAILTGMDLIGPAFLILMSLSPGVLNSFDTPLRQSLIYSFVGQRDDLGNALALNAMLFNIGRSIGPPIAGLLVGLTSEAVCFAMNGCSFLALMVGLIVIESVAPPRATGSIRAVFYEGARYAWHTWPVRMLILTLVALNLTASAYAVLLPVFASDIFAGNATTLGWLWGAAGAGAFASTGFLATRLSNRAIFSTLVVGLVISTTSIVFFALCATLPLAIAAMVGVGWGISACNNGINILLQSIAPEQLRGCVVSFFTSARFGFDAIGGLLAGFVASAMGVKPTLLIEGGILLLFLAFFLARRVRLLTAIVQSNGDWLRLP
jgi:MFS family permease